MDMERERLDDEDQAERENDPHESAEAVYGDTDLNPNADDQKKTHTTRSLTNTLKPSLTKKKESAPKLRMIRKYGKAITLPVCVGVSGSPPSLPDDAFIRPGAERNI